MRHCQQRKPCPPAQWLGPGRSSAETLNNNNNNEEEEDGGGGGGEDDGQEDWHQAAKRRRSEDVREARFSPRPLAVLPAWWHPPLALPSLAITKEEVQEPSPGPWPNKEAELPEQGVTPPLMSPADTLPVSPLSGIVSPFPVSGPGGAAAAPVDPRHILQLLARKVGHLATMR